MFQWVSTGIRRYQGRFRDPQGLFRVSEGILKKLWRISGRLRGASYDFRSLRGRPGGSRGVSMSLGVSGEFQTGIRGVSGGTEFQGCALRSQRRFRRFQGVPGGFRSLLGISRCPMRCLDGSWRSQGPFIGLIELHGGSRWSLGCFVILKRS